MSQFLHHDDNDAKAIAIPRVFSGNSRAKKVKFRYQAHLCTIWHTSGDGTHRITRLLFVEEYASDRCITGSTPYYMPLLEFIRNRS